MRNIPKSQTIRFTAPLAQAIDEGHKYVLKRFLRGQIQLKIFREIAEILQGEEKGLAELLCKLTDDGTPINCVNVFFQGKSLRLLGLYITILNEMDGEQLRIKYAAADRCREKDPYEPRRPDDAIEQKRLAMLAAIEEIILLNK